MKNKLLRVVDTFTAALDLYQPFTSNQVVSHPFHAQVERIFCAQSTLAWTPF